MPDDWKPSLIQLLMVVIITALTILGITKYRDWYCEKYGDKYTQSSECFDINYRCKVECGNYNMNFSGVIENFCRCYCDYPNYFVSYCSGFLYNNTTGSIS